MQSAEPGTGAGRPWYHTDVSQLSQEFENLLSNIAATPVIPNDDVRTMKEQARRLDVVCMLTSSSGRHANARHPWLTSCLRPKPCPATDTPLLCAATRQVFSKSTYWVTGTETVLEYPGAILFKARKSLPG